MGRTLWTLALLCLAAPVRAENLSSLQNDARVLALDAVSTTRQRFTGTQIAQLLNTAQRQAVAQTWCLEQSIQLTLTPGVTYYALPSDYLAMHRVIVGGKYIQEQTPASLDGRSRGWESASGYPVYYFINQSSPTALGFTPWPAQAADTDTVKYEYFQDAADLVNPGDLPFNGVTKYNEYHQALAYFAAAIMLQTYGDAQDAQAYMGVYTSAVNQMGKQCRNRPSYLPGATGAP